jgi:hypothetical protein
MRRTLLLSVLIFVGCHGTSYYQNKVANTCPGNGTPGDAPIVCVNADLQPTPEPVHLKRGHWAHFFFTGGSDGLEIRSDVLENVGHDRGHAWGRAKADATVGRHKYSIVDTTTGKSNDPEVMIDP